jgi:hypothetical protein
MKKVLLHHDLDVDVDDDEGEDVDGDSNPWNGE